MTLRSQHDEKHPKVMLKIASVNNFSALSEHRKQKKETNIFQKKTKRKKKINILFLLQIIYYTFTLGNIHFNNIGYTFTI